MKISRSPLRISYSIFVCAVCLGLCALTWHFEGTSPWLIGGIVLSLGIALAALVEQSFSEKHSLIFFLIAPFLTFYCLESMTHDPWKMDIIPQLVNVLFYYLVYILLLMLTTCSRAAVLLSNVLFFCIGIANYYTMEFRDSPILPWDLRSIGTALSITDNYTFAVDYRLLYLILFFIALIVLGEKTAIRIRRSKLRLKASLASLGLIVFLYTALQFSIVTDNLMTFSNLFTQWATYRDNGFVASFIMNMRYMNIEKPDDYETTLKALTEKLLPNETGGAGSTGAAADKDAADSEALPNVIVVMNEAFSDLSVIHEFSTDQDYMPHVRALMNDPNTISGQLYVSVCGGNTANTEFEFITGNTMGFLPSGSVAYQQYIKDETPSYASMMNALGYTTFGIHPYYASGWDRDEVYPWLGFETSLFRNNFLHNQENIIRRYLSDQSLYEKIIALYEADSTGNPQFFFNVTMQNHGGYSQIYENFPIQVHITEEKTFEATEHYLTLVQESDRAFQELIDYFSEAEEDTIILLFGDHQPGDYVASLITRMTGKTTEEMTLAEQQNRYKVPFVIWANFDMENAGDRYEAISANYLSGILSEAAGLPLTPYQTYLQELSEILPVITGNVVVDSEGNFYPIKQPGEYAKLLHEYSVLQYNYLFDKAGRVEELFE